MPNAPPAAARQARTDETTTHFGTVKKVDRYKWSDPGAPGELLWVDPKEVNIDHESYQRTAKDQKVLDIARGLSWPKFGVVSLCRRSDGSFWCIDGQHRVLAARRHGISRIPAIVFPMTSAAEEADAFLGLNTLSKPLTGVEKHLARTTRLDPAAALVDQLITSANRVASANSTANSVRCIAAMTKLATTSPETLKKLWPAVASISEGGPLHERFLVGMVWLEDHLAEDSLIDPRWLKRLMAAGAEGCIAAINRSVAFHVKGGERVYAEGLLQLLNRGLREDRHLKIRGAS